MRNLFFIFLLFLSCQAKEQETHRTPVFPVKVTKVIVKPVEEFVEAVGHVVAISTVEIRSQVEGELIGVFFEEGKEINQGDLLFTIDPRPFEAALNQSKADLQKTQAELLFAEQKMTRYEGLLKKDYFSEIDYEQIISEVSINKALVEKQKAQIDEDQINLDYCWIYAPIDAKTGILNIHRGNLVRKNEDRIITLNQMAPIYVEFSIAEKDFSKVIEAKQNKTLVVKAAYNNFHGMTFQGDLDFIDNSVDKQTGMIKLRGIFANQNRMLWPGQFVRARLILKTDKQSLVIPFSALQLLEKQAFVFVLKNGRTVEKKLVKLGQRDEENIQILEGLKPGEQIVVEGQLNLSNGSQVSVQKDEPL